MTSKVQNIFKRKVFFFPFLTLLVAIVFSPLAYGQDLDLHFSQFHLAPSRHNPAMTGNFDGQVRYTGLYRRQWQRVPVDYLTLGALIDGQLELPVALPGQFAAGGILLYDEAGDARLRYTEVGLTLSWTYPLAEGHRLSIGFRGSQVSRRFSDANLRWDAQFDGEQYNPNLFSQETLESFSGAALNTGTGINWNLTKSSRHYFNAGWSIRNITPTAIRFTSGDLATWALRQSFFGSGSMPLQENLDVRLAVMGQLQSRAQELLLNAGIRYHLPREGKQLTSIGVNIGVRMNDALIPSIELRHGPWLAGVSYDINTSGFSRATNGQGGPELVLVYLFKKVGPPDAFRSCPVF